VVERCSPNVRLLLLNCNRVIVIESYDRGGGHYMRDKIMLRSYWKL